MKSIVYEGPDRAVQIDGKRLNRGVETEVPNDLADELLKGSDRLPGDHSFKQPKQEKKDDKSAEKTPKGGSGGGQSQPDATTRADQ